MKNFLPEHRAKVVGLLDTMFGCSPAVFAILYASVFSGGHFEDPENQNVAGFMLMFAVLYGVTNLLCVFALREVPPDENVSYTEMRDKANVKTRSLGPEYKSITLLSDESLSSCSNDANSTDEFDVMDSNDSNLNEQIGPRTIDMENDASGSKWMAIHNFIVQALKRVLSTDFQLLFWTFIINVATASMIYNNITVVLKSTNIVEHQTVFTVIIGAVGVPTRLIISVLSDWFKPTVPRSITLVLASAINLFCHVMCSLYSDSYEVLLTVTILIGIVLGIMWMMGPTITSEMFDLEHFGFNWGVFLFGHSMLVFAVQWIFGSVFDSHSIPGTHDCSGNECFRGSFIVSSCMIAVSLVTSIILFAKTKRLTKKT